MHRWPNATVFMKGSTKWHWAVGGNDEGLRLDKFLAAQERLGSRGRALAAIQRGKVFLNGVEAQRAQAATSLAAGDIVRLWLDRPGTAKRIAAATHVGDLRVVYEDDELMVVNKPAGLLAVPLGTRDAPSAYDQLKDHFRSRKRRPFVVHRIDRDTSGLVVFAKGGETQRQLKDQFRRREPERVYWAVVYGHPQPSKGVWRDRLVWDSDRLVQKETHPRDPLGKEAISEYRVLEAFRDASLIEVRLKTGKQNQIRIQAHLRGHTVVGEQKYTFQRHEPGRISFSRQALHAYRLTFRHPKDGRSLEFEAPLPGDLRELIASLRSLPRDPAPPGV